MEDVGMADDVRRFRVSSETFRVQRVAMYIRHLVEGLSTTSPVMSRRYIHPFAYPRYNDIYGQDLSGISSLQAYSHLMKEKVAFANELVCFDSVPSNEI